MKRLALALAVCAALACGHARSGSAASFGCGLPGSTPLWADYAESSVPFWNTLFLKRGLVLATSGIPASQIARNGGPATVYWEMHLQKYVGTPAAPADPGSIAAAANGLVDRAIGYMACASPAIVLNEFLSPTARQPLAPQNAQYRADVLAFVQAIAARGSHVFLLTPSPPNVDDANADYWRRVAESASVVVEKYLSGSKLYGEGSVLANRQLRQTFRGAVGGLLGIGVPGSSLGLVLGFQSVGMYGRTGLPLAPWLDVVKWNTLAAKEVAAEDGLGSIWSWGWADYDSPDRSEKAVAACVYLWTRDPSLCDVSGLDFDSSLADAQLSVPAGAECVFADGRRISIVAVDRLAAVTKDRQTALLALVERMVQAPLAPVPFAAVAAAERGVLVHFRGSRPLYLAALARLGLTEDTARAILKDELRRQRLAGTEDVVADEQKLLDTATCAGDVVPAAADVRLADSLPFLRLASVS